MRMPLVDRDELGAEAEADVGGANVSPCSGGWRQCEASWVGLFGMEGDYSPGNGTC